MFKDVTSLNKTDTDGLYTYLTNKPYGVKNNRYGFSSSLRLLHNNHTYTLIHPPTFPISSLQIKIFYGVSIVD